MIKSLTWPLGFGVDVFDYFLKKFASFCSVKVLGIDPLSLKSFKLIHTYKPKAKNWTNCGQLD
jgi:hypothetical protein